MAKSGKRQSIVDAAYRRFFQLGYNGCGVQDIADAAGVPKGTFYNYFKSKEQLALEVIEIYRRHLTDTLAVEGSDSPFQRLRAHFASLAERYAAVDFAQGCLLGNFGAEIAGASGPLRESLEASFDRWGADVATVIRQAQAAGEIDARHDARRLANALVDAWEGATLRTKIERTQRPVDNFFAVVFDPLRV